MDRLSQCVVTAYGRTILRFTCWLVVASFALAGSTGAASADTTAVTNVKTVWQYTQSANNGRTFVYLTGATCAPSTSPFGYFIIYSDDPQQNNLRTLALAAYLAKSPVSLDYEPSTCRVLSIKLHAR
jgi:hypothetical protein